MKNILAVLVFTIIAVSCTTDNSKTNNYYSISTVKEGKPVSVKLTSYSTTLIANGADTARIRITVIDSIGREILTSHDSIIIELEGHGRLSDLFGNTLNDSTITNDASVIPAKLTDGALNLFLISGHQAGKIVLKVKSGDLWTASHEIHTVPGDFEYLTPTDNQLKPTTKSIDRMIGADVSWLPQLEDDGRKFFDSGKQISGLDILKKYGFNFVRLRIFVNPENENGYSPVKGYCGFDQTLLMAKRVKDSGLKLLLDFHYSDYWADPQKQFKPSAWENLPFTALCDTLEEYTYMVISALKQQGTMPDMVQIGNEINHGMVWPEGHISNPDGLAKLLIAGTNGVEKVDPDIPIMMHVALGGLNKESVFWFDNMIARGVEFDIIGISYYPRWHGTLEDLNYNLNDLIVRYIKPINVVEYSDYKQEVHDIVFNLPDEMGKGAAIWEPLNWGSMIINRDGSTNESIKVYKKLSNSYLN